MTGTTDSIPITRSATEPSYVTHEASELGSFVIAHTAAGSLDPGGHPVDNLIVYAVQE